MHRIDDLQCNGLRIIQDTDGFCFGVDAVLLAYFSNAGNNEQVLDLCTGNGIIPILIAGKTNALSVVGIEIQQKTAELARQSVKLNKLDERVDIICGDIRDDKILSGSKQYDLVTCNPPYIPSGHGLINPNDELALAKHEITCSLRDAVYTASKVLGHGGRFCMVHRPARLVDIIFTMREYKLEPKRMKMAHPFLDKNPSLLLIEGVKYGKPQMTIEPPIIIFNEDNSYTEQINEIYNR